MKTLIFLNLRFANFYSENLLKNVKERENLRVVVIVDQQFKNRIPKHFLLQIDELYYLESNKKNNFLGEFNMKALRPIIEKELLAATSLKIICADEFNLLNAGQLRREYHLGGHTDHDLLPFRDKVIMKSILYQNKIRVPKYKLSSLCDNYITLASNFGLPFIIKPKDSCGSHNICKIQNLNDYEHWLANQFIHENDFEVEEFIQGKLFHVDSWTQNSDIKFICASEYTFPNYEYTQGKPLGSIPLKPDNPLAIRLIDFAKKCLLALEANNLINHMELFVTENDEIIFLEVSARPPGALVNLTHTLNFGVNLMDKDFFLQADIKPIDHEYNPTEEKVFWTFFPLSPGTVKKLHLPSVKSRMQLDWFTHINAKISSNECNTIVNKAAQAIFYHHDETILRNDFELIKSHKILEIK